MDQETQRGLMLVVSSPSGGGKTTLCRKLVQEHPRLGCSVSYTTRAPRGAEVDGTDYHFVDDATFDQMVREERFAEWARVHGNRYGTARHTVDDALEAGQDLVFDIDWQGAYQLQDAYPADAVLVFVLPPSMQVLASRLRGRGTDTEDVIAGRLRVAQEEIARYVRYDYLVVNDALEQAYDDLRCVYRAALASRPRRRLDAERLLQQR